jgi:hypothetical protein
MPRTAGGSLSDSSARSPSAGERYRLAVDRATDADSLLSAGLATDPATIDPSIKLAADRFAAVGVEREGGGHRSTLGPSLVGIVGAGYVIGRRQLGAGEPPPSQTRSSEEVGERALELLRRVRDYDLVGLQAAIPLAVQRVGEQLADQAVEVAGGRKSRGRVVRRLAWQGFTTGLALAAAEADLVEAELAPREEGG